MICDVVIEDPRWAHLGLEALAERAARATLAHQGIASEGREIAVLGCDDARIAALNADFRAKPSPTNVLSWPSEDLGSDIPGEAPIPPDAAELGDIAVAWETCAREADAAQKEMSAHVTHLLVHGLLHLLGFDHVEDADAALMEGLEHDILGALGEPAPYPEPAFRPPE